MAERFEEFRSPFFGRSGVQFWWGGCDFTVALFNGRAASAPTDLGYIMQYDLDAEHFNAGFWPGDDSAPEPSLYAYLVPRPPGCEGAPIAPPFAGWVETMGEWMMSYAEVRTCGDPRQAILDFLEALTPPPSLSEAGTPAHTGTTCRRLRRAADRLEGAPCGVRGLRGTGAESPHPMALLILGCRRLGPRSS